ncbi:MAG: T9SS type A sorting domain-containing protein [Cyclobacteriaceae bacterium]
MNGNLPAEIGDFSELKLLNVSHNDLSGNLGESILNLRQLESLILTANQFTGEIPEDIDRLENLTSIQIDVNEIAGGIPPSIVNLTELLFIGLNNNNIVGTIPEDIGRLTKLGTLILSSNNLSGTIPPSIGDLRALTYLNLAGNEFSGSIPDKMGQLDELKYLFLNSNLLSGPIPLSFTNMTNLALLEDQSVFNYSSTDLCEPDSRLFRDWKEGRNVGGTDQICGQEDHGTLELDSMALVALYESTDGENWYETENWLTNDIGTWYGVEITDSRVTKVVLNGNNLSGLVPTQLTDISKLNYLDLSDNPLESPVLSYISELPNIEYVNFSYCNLEEEFPQGLHELIKLDAIELDYNFIFGFLPETLSNSSSLTYISIQGNELTGQVPESYASLTQLEYFSYSGNYLCDPSSPTFDEWKSTRQVYGDEIMCIDLAQIELFGFDEQIGQTQYDQENFTVSIVVDRGVDITQLVPHFTISSGASIDWCESVGYDIPLISGESIIDFTETVCLTITSEFEIENVDWLISVKHQEGLVSDSLSLVAFYESTGGQNWTNKENWLTGPLNTWFGVSLMNDRVSSILLSGNNLTGHIPEEIGELDSLKTLTLGINGIGGVIPDEIGGLRILETLNLFGNAIVGSIPSEIEQMTRLWRLDLSANQLSGSLPEEIAHLELLNHLELGFNRFNGPLPAFISDLKQLETLDLSYNEFSGGIPSNWSELTSLKHIDLSSNNLSGPLPEVFGQLSLLEKLELSNNSLTGEIPLSWYDLSKLQVLDLHDNKLNGRIDSSIGNLHELLSLYLSENNLDGPIPDSIGQLSKLKVLNLSNNMLTGIIPNSVGEILDLIALQVDHNPLGGTLPISIVNLEQLALNSTYILDFSNTDICEPQSDIYEDWKIDRFIESSGISCEINGFISFSIAGFPEVANIDYVARTINIELANAELTNLIAQFELPEGASVYVEGTLQESGHTSNDFSETVVYTLVLQNGTENEWLVTISSVVTGVEALLKDISIFPNPVQNILHVEDALSRIRSIQFLNLAGQLTRTFNATQDGQYDISSLNNGMYMMRIELEGKQLVHTKVLIRH